MPRWPLAADDGEATLPDMLVPLAMPRIMDAIIVGVAGGIAAYKACSVVRQLTEAGHQVRVVPTESALKFVGAATFEALSGFPVHTGVFTDVHEVPHVRIGQEADLVVVAPATADVLARAAAGRADDLLTATLLTARCPVLFAPAMHTEMWQHPATCANVATLRSRGTVVLEPASGRLTGADTGPGRLPEPEEITAFAELLLERGDALVGPGRGPRLVGALEAGPLAPYLSDLSAIYPYRIGCGVAVETCDLLMLSKHPMANPQFVSLSDLRQNRFAVATILVGGEPVEFAAIHVTKPYFDDYHTMELRRASRILKERGGTLVIGGDFNSDTIAPDMQRFLRRGNLQTAGVEPATWPVEARIFGIPIDHIYTSKTIVPTALERIADNYGSNHYGLIADLILTKAFIAFGGSAS